MGITWSNNNNVLTQESNHSNFITRDLLKSDYISVSINKHNFAIKPLSSNVKILSAEDIKTMPQSEINNKENYIEKKTSTKFSNNDLVIYNKSSGILTDALTKDELLKPKEKERRKAIKEQFKKFLQTERIHFQFPRRSKNEKGYSAIAINWQGFKEIMGPQDFILKIFNFSNRRFPGFPDRNQQLLLNTLNKYPVFTVENNLRQIILAYPAEAFIKSFTDKLYDYYYRVFEWEKDTRATNIGFFFFNPEDAYLYNYNIRKFGPLAAADLGTRVVPFNMSAAYKLHRTSSPETRFLFIPDIKEVGDLLNIYRRKYGNKMRFHDKQKLTKDGFANQPIYMIQDMRIRKNIFSKIDVKYQGEFKDHEYIFFSLEGAEEAWKNFCLKSSYKLPPRPNILVYNFNNFIQDCEQDNQLVDKKFKIVSNRETYDLLHKFQNVEQNKNNLHKFYENRIASKLFFIQLWFNRFRLVLFHAPRINEYPRRDLIVSQNEDN
uniref:hypothetical protein n=1 Tax=Stylonema alsidii TaxID=35155 RepID=UPI001FCDD935|nr:hypothetical protein MW559_pgp193 [Stylonema alsidii]UNJ15099.1 hypothetical protein [Stylonema alsidii]